MQIIKFLTISLLISITLSGHSQDTLRVTYSYESGFGELDLKWRIARSEKSEIVDLFSGVPKSWEQVKIKKVIINHYQNNYQVNKFENKGAILKRFSEFTNPSYLHLADETIRCFFHILSGYIDNDLYYIIDENNNNDFSDETSYRANEIGIIDKDSLVNHSLSVKMEEYTQGEVKEFILPINVAKKGNEFDKSILFYTYPQHLKSEIEKIEISTSFLNTSLENFWLKVRGDEGVYYPGDVIEIGEYQLKILGINHYKKVLEFKILKNANIVSSSVGFTAPDFKEKLLKSQMEITLKDYEGKYLFINFWGTWCSGCIKEIPYQKEAYNALDKSKISFLAIAAYDSEQKVIDFIREHQIKWDQVVKNNSDGILKSYSIPYFPSNYLINPDGIIIDRFIPGDKLLQTIDSYLME